MFPLNQRQIGGYHFDVPTFYNEHHCGVDYRAKYVPLYAPFNGTILEAFQGPEGGKTIWFRPDHDDVIMRFMHLDYFPVKKGERVTQGQQIAITGNTGKFTTGAHMHCDVSRGSFVLKWPGHFIDPEQYNWDWSPEAPTPTPPVEIPISFWITVDAPLGSANFRSDPALGGKVMATYANGEDIECIATVDGQEVTVHDKDGTPRTSSKWYKSALHGWYISSTVAKHN